MILEYKLKYNPLGQERKYKLSKKKRLKLEDTSTWIENDLKNQWYFKDYKCYYIVVSQFDKAKFKVSCSGANAGEFKDLETAKVEALKFCDKIYK